MGNGKPGFCLLLVCVAVELGLARPPCPNVTCPDVTFAPNSTGDICARITAQGFEVQSSSQTQTPTCRLYDILPIYWSKSAEGTLIYAANITLPDISPDLGITCPRRQPNSDLIDYKPNEALRSCGNSQDCRLQNGAEAECVCGLDGYSYCLPDNSSSVFEEFWGECEHWGNLSRYKYWKKWVYFSSYYVMWATTANMSCVKQTIMEIFEIVRDLDLAAKVIPSILLILTI